MHLCFNRMRNRITTKFNSFPKTKNTLRFILLLHDNCSHRITKGVAFVVEHKGSGCVWTNSLVSYTMLISSYQLHLMIVGNLFLSHLFIRVLFQFCRKTIITGIWLSWHMPEKRNIKETNTKTENAVLDCMNITIRWQIHFVKWHALIEVWTIIISVMLTRRRNWTNPCYINLTLLWKIVYFNVISHVMILLCV